MISLRLDDLEKMMTEFKKIPSRLPSRTLMDVAGYPHYENVCSNILAFYFDPAAEHGMKDLLIRALLVCLGIESKMLIKHADVEREVYSERRGRLDILIEAGGLVIGIENKIWAGLGNDLHDYRDLISGRAKTKQIIPDSTHYVVLSLRPLDVGAMHHLSKAGFRNVIYPKFIEATRSLLGQYATHANLKFLGFFTDFMQTIDNLTGPQEDADTARFFAKNGVLIEELTQKYLQYRNGKAPAMMALTKPWLEGHLKEDEFKQSIYYKTTLITHIRGTGKHRERAISIDLVYEPGDWSINLFSRGFTDYKMSAACNSFFNGLIPKLLRGLAGDWVKNENAVLRRTLPAETSNEAMALNVEAVFLAVMRVLGIRIGAE